MRLSQAYAAVDEQGVVGPGWQLGHREARGLGELVRRSHDERVEGIAAVELRWRGRRAGRGRPGRSGRGPIDADGDQGVGPEAGLGGSVKVREVVLDDVGSDELAGDAQLDLVVPVGEQPAGPDPRVEGLRRELALER